MKTVFKLFALTESGFIKATWLASDGVRSDEEMIVVRKHVADFDNEPEAFKFMSEQDSPEHGFEIIRVHINN